jgi:hypothetical protein
MLTVSAIFGQNSDLFSYNNSNKYADYLYDNGEYLLAIPEFKRLLFFDATNTQANIKIHDSFIRLGKYEEGIKYSDQLHPNSFSNDTLTLMRGKLLLLNRDFSRFDNEILKKPLIKKDMDFLRLSEAMFLKEWENALSYTSDIEKYSDFYRLTPIIKNASELKYKSPGLSLTMSAIIPGSGKIYSGYWKDGLFSFLFVGVSAWQSYRGFNQKGMSSFYGWMMGGISLSFYTGNLYGSVKAANKRNHELDHSILDEFEKVFISTYSNF